MAFLGYTLHSFMLLMLLPFFRVDENIINEDYNEPVDIVSEDTIR